MLSVSLMLVARPFAPLSLCLLPLLALPFVACTVSAVEPPMQVEVAGEAPDSPQAACVDCGGREEKEAGAEASADADAGSNTDADSGADAGLGFDAGADADAGANADAGGGTDAGGGADGGVAGTCVEPGLYARFKLDEGAGSLAGDCSGNGLVLNKIGSAFGTFSWVTGYANKAIRFGYALRPEDAATLVKSSTPSLTGSVTVAAWVKLEGDPLPGSTGGYVVKHGTLARGFWIYVNGRTPRFEVRSDSGSAVALDAPSALTLGRWTHLAASVDVAGGVTRMYVDGAEVASTNSAPQPGDATGALMVGGAVRSAVLNGTLDEIRIHTRALVAAEIAALAGK